MNFYEKLKPYILEQRRGEPTYALHYEWFYINLISQNSNYRTSIISFHNRKK